MEGPNQWRTKIPSQKLNKLMLACNSYAIPVVFETRFVYRIYGTEKLWYFPQSDSLTYCNKQWFSSKPK